MRYELSDCCPTLFEYISRLTAYHPYSLSLIGWHPCSLSYCSWMKILMGQPHEMGGLELIWACREMVASILDYWANLPRVWIQHLEEGKCRCVILCTRAGNLLIWFPSESLVFCQKMSQWAIHSKKWAIHSFAHFWWATLANCSWSLIFCERPERFAHIAHQKRGNEWIAHFFL